MQRQNKYTFDNYIICKANELAYFAAAAVAEKPGVTYNPLLVCGSSGLGKTHLLNAVYNRIKDFSPDKHVLLCTAEEITDVLVDALKAKKQGLWYEEYLSADVLLIDDMQSLAGKLATQAAFVNLFHNLVDKGKQVVLASSVPAEELLVLESSLRSDYSHALFADIRPLSTDECRSIIQSKSAEAGLQISNESVECIALHAKGEVRRIEGIVTCLNARKDLIDSPVDNDVVFNVCLDCCLSMTRDYLIPDIAHLKAFLSKHSGQIIKQKLTAYYCSTEEGVTKDPLVLSFGKTSFFLDYSTGALRIRVFDSELLELDPSLNILYRKAPDGYNTAHYCPLRAEHPYIGKKADRIWYVIRRDNKSFESVLIRFEDDCVLSISAVDNASAGNMLIEKEVMPNHESRLVHDWPSWLSHF